MQLMPILLVAAGGATGAVARYLTYLGVRSFPTLPTYAATLTVNLLGCLIIGFLLTIFERYQQTTSPLMLLTVTGFLGSYTTFSTFGWESYNLINSNLSGLVISVASNLILGILLVWAGRSIALWV